MRSLVDTEPVIVLRSFFKYIIVTFAFHSMQQVKICLQAVDSKIHGQP